MTTALEADARSGKLKQISITLGTAGTVTTVNLPSPASGFRITAGSAAIIYAISDTPVAIATSNSQTINATDFSNGNTVAANNADTRLIEAASGQLKLVSATNSATCTLEVW